MTKPTYLVVGNGMNWGKGRTLLAAFANCMEHDSNIYPTSKLYVRKLTPPEGWTLDAESFFERVTVDGMGNGEWPAGSVVQKIDLGKGEQLADKVSAALKAYRTFKDEWNELVCTDAMDEAFGGDIGDGA